LIKNQKILLTGGAGFIGSNIAAALLDDERVARLRVLDNLSTGFRRNIEPFLSHPKFEFMEGDISDYDTCLRACTDMQLVCHQAALGSVSRSIENPLRTNEVNITGHLNILHAAVQNNIRRVVFAASSSTYGDSENLPKVEDIIGKPLSPYAVTKYVNELYAHVFALNYGLEYVGLRYFNVFGPNQDPHGAYAAVIPLFFKAALDGVAPTIHGDGTNSRDFTYVANTVEANLLALFTERKEALNHIYNIACGEQTSLNELWEKICEVTGCNIPANYGPYRKGDIPHSLADISKAKELLGYKGDITMKEGLERALHWYKK
jgi:UDP-N-acetylglucosamine/UDP-N-acetylgalactosamine 4-epimerase